MSTTRLETLLLKLQEQTEFGNVTWEKTTEDRQFQTVLGNYTLRLIESWGDNIEPDYVLKIQDQEGALVETISDTELFKQSPEFPAYNTMGNIFRLARRSAMGADKAIDSIINELDSIPLF